MKKVLVVLFAMLVITGLAVAQNAGNATGTNIFTGGSYTSGTGIPFNIDKLGAHQNGGRGCVGCHAPHSGARGNGGAMAWDSASSSYKSVAVVGLSGDEVLWGQDLGPIYGKSMNFPKTAGVTITATSQERMITGVAMCLSCHDGNVAKGAMMTNQSFEQAAGLLPAGYGDVAIPTLLGADGGSYGNYQNDHPIGPEANMGALPIGSAKGFFQFDTAKTKLVKGPGFLGSTMAKFADNYALPSTVDARTGAGFVVETSMSSVDEAYVVCTTCHTPHSMYTASGTYGKVKGVYPSYFFIAAAYNPGANVADGKAASSATQFCRQCHFTGAGGSNEGSGISIPTAF